MRSPNRLETTTLALSSLVVAGAVLEGVAFWRGIRRSRALARDVRRFERRLGVGTRGALVLGDSTGVGVGALLPEESIAGLLAADFPDVDIVNVSQSGARVETTRLQAERCLETGRRFDVAILHVGANDIVRKTPPDRLAVECDALLDVLSRVARRTVWLGPPNVGMAPLFPPPYSWVLSRRSRQAARIFSEAAARHDIDFIDFSAPAHGVHFSRQRRQHFAVDGFHPNSSCYRYGYAAARQRLGLDPLRAADAGGQPPSVR